MKNYLELTGDNSHLFRQIVSARRTCEMLAGLIQNQSITSGFHPTFISTSLFDHASVFRTNMHDAEFFLFFHLFVLELGMCDITRLARAAELPKNESCRCI